MSEVLLPVVLVLLVIALMAMTSGLWGGKHRAQRAPRPFPSPPVSAPSERAEASASEPRPALEEPMREFLALSLDDTPFEALDVALAPECEMAVEAAAATLASIDARPEDMPRRPALLPQLLTAVKDDGESMRTIARIIGQDPALTGNLLRIANSAFYRINEKPIESIDRAVTMVGTEGIRSIIATALVQPVMSRTGGPFGRFPEKIWEHTLLSATAAESYAARVDGADPFLARLAALVFGLANIVAFRVARDEFARRPVTSRNGVAFYQLLERAVPHTARSIAVHWHLPPQIMDAVQGGDVPDSPVLQTLRFGRVAGALLMLCRADRIKEAAARASLIARETRGAQVARVWTRLVEAYGRPQ